MTVSFSERGVLSGMRDRRSAGITEPSPSRHGTKPCCSRGRPAAGLPQAAVQTCNPAPCGGPAPARRREVVGISNCSSEEQPDLDGVSVIVPTPRICGLELPAPLRISASGYLPRPPRAQRFARLQTDRPARQTVAQLSGSGAGGARGVVRWFELLLDRRCHRRAAWRRDGEPRARSGTPVRGSRRLPDLPASQPAR